MCPPPPPKHVCAIGRCKAVAKTLAAPLPAQGHSLQGGENMSAPPFLQMACALQFQSEGATCVLSPPAPPPSSPPPTPPPPARPPPPPGVPFMLAND